MVYVSQVKPTFKTQPDSLIETDFGKTVQLKCDGIANPPANITWYKNAQPIDFDKSTNMQLRESMTKLVINNISINDQAIYQCFLANQAGQISASTLIKIISFAPKFTQTVQNRTVYSDSNVELSCGKVDASPKPRITWSRIQPAATAAAASATGDMSSEQSDEETSSTLIGHGLLDDSNNDESSSSMNNNYNLERLDEKGFGTNANGELVIKNANGRHQGWYKCEASNLLGQVEAKMFLQVKSNLKFLINPNEINEIVSKFFLLLL